MPRGFRNPSPPDTNTVADACDIDETDAPALDNVMKGGMGLPDPDFDLIRQAYPNRPRPDYGPDRPDAPS